MKRPLLIVTLGYPGSGKTYFSERFSKKHRFFHLNGDLVRMAMFRSPSYSRKEHTAVYRFADNLARMLLGQGVSVIYDANFNFRKSRKNARRIANNTHAEYRLLWVKTAEEKAIQRLSKRAMLKSPKKKELYRPINISNFRDLQSEIEPPTKSEAFIEIDGHKAFREQVKSFWKRYTETRT